ncbi:MAG: hypothetical protein KAR83_03685 [Thermodesulfovibrionales bacterium]|nr:hypothetical protein [Thermodesulfovibrionales bacterium]
MSVAEYLGQRCDVNSPVIEPKSGSSTLCPFMSAPCTKMRDRTNAESYKPVCAVRKRDGTVWIVCGNRLCATKKDIPLTVHQKEILMQVAKTVYSPDITEDDVLVKRESPMPAPGNSIYHADFIMVNGGDVAYAGPRSVVLEMQGGGETSNTGKLSKHVNLWENSTPRTNTGLSEPVSGPGPIITNAWRRQQEQFLVKGRIAMITGDGNGMVFCVGSLFYDYIFAKIQRAGLQNLRDHNWTLALIGFSEDTTSEPVAGPIPFKVDTTKLLFTDYQTFVRALTDQGDPCPEAFQGDFDKLSGGTKTIT